MKTNVGEGKCDHCRWWINSACFFCHKMSHYITIQRKPELTNTWNDQICTCGFIWLEEANSCDLSVPRPWNSSLLMFYGKRNLFLVDCTSDSWQMTLSLQVSGAETKLRTGLLPNLLEPARDAQMPAFTDAIAKNTENITVENGVICFVLLLASWPVSTWERQKTGWEADHFLCLFDLFIFFPTSVVRFGHKWLCHWRVSYLQQLTRFSWLRLL